MTRVNEEKFDQEFDCPILKDVAIIQITRRSFKLPDGQIQFARPMFGGCDNVWDCGVVAKGSPYGNASFDWPNCAAFKAMNSSGKA